MVWCSVPRQTWFHLAITWKKDTKTMVGYVNGLVKGTYVSTFTGDMTYMTNSHNTYDIGFKRDSSQSIQGHVKDLAVFGRVLTAEEIQGVYG